MLQFLPCMIPDSLSLTPHPSLLRDKHMGPILLLGTGGKRELNKQNATFEKALADRSEEDGVSGVWKARGVGV